MTQIGIDDRIAAPVQEYARRLATLLDSQPFYLVDIAVSQPKASQVPGVYLILSPPNAYVVYAGKTNDQGLICRRMLDHRLGNATRDLPIMLQHHPNMIQDVKEYQVKWTEIQDPRDRYLFEQFVTGVLRPMLNG